MLLKCLHHGPHEVQHTQQFTEPLLAEETVLSLQLKYTQGTALHGTYLYTHRHKHTHIEDRHTGTDTWIHTE